MRVSIDRRSFVIGALKVACVVSLPIPPLHRAAKHKLAMYDPKNVIMTFDGVEVKGFSGDFKPISRQIDIDRIDQ